MKRTCTFIIIVLLSIALFISTKYNKQEIPSGIDPKDWIPINDNFGFAIQKLDKQKTKFERESATGYLMARKDNDWIIIYPELPPVRAEFVK